ncbi:MAG: efflux RND transporter periplasmic adaptor subunit [Acidobacteria bacterium]|nr:efflux RND transporter periplasmic adaptor subunit [Acidobacteriota bacterium]
MAHLLRRTAVPLLIIAGGIMLAVLLARSRTTPPREVTHNTGPLVAAVTVHKTTVPIVIPGNGTVRAKVSAQLVPQVGGRIIAMHPAMTAGGFFKAGETLVTIDPADYELAVEKAAAQVTGARVGLEIARANAEIARNEWNTLHPGQKPPNPLVVKKPQLEQAEANLAAARAQLATARLNLARTRLSFPFDGRVVSKSADIGQYVGPGQPIGHVYGTAAVEIPVPLVDADLAWFDVPKPGAAPESGARVDVTADFGGRRLHWTGHVVRTEGEIDIKTRMIHVVVEVLHPFHRGSGTRSLLPGMFVTVAIHGRPLHEAVPIPRSAIHGGTSAWVVRNHRLSIVPVHIARYDGDTALVTSGLDDGDVVVTSQLEIVTNGMLVRVAHDPAATRTMRAGDPK